MLALDNRTRMEAVKEMEHVLDPKAAGNRGGKSRWEVPGSRHSVVSSMLNFIR